MLSPGAARRVGRRPGRAARPLAARGGRLGERCDARPAGRPAWTASRSTSSCASRPARCVALLGPNGAGKTTALRALAGLLPLDRRAHRPRRPGARRPAAASVRRSDRADRRGLPGLPAVPAPDRAGQRRLRPARPRAAPRPRPAARGRLARPRRAGRPRRHRPRQLSGGQAQRVALARALAPTPAAAARRAARRAGRRHPAGVRADLRRHLAATAGRRCWSPTTRSTRWCSPTGWSSSRTAGSSSRAAGRGRPPPAHRLRRPPGRPEPLPRHRPGRPGRRSPAAASLVRRRTATGPVLVALRRPRSRCTATGPDGSPRNVWPAASPGSSSTATGSGSRRPARRRRRRRHPGGVAELDLAAGPEVWVAVKATEVTVYPV